MIHFTPQFHQSATDVMVSVMSSAAHGGHHEPSLMEWLLSTNVFNIVLVAIILGWVIKKFNVLDVFPQQQQSIQKQVSDLESQRKEAEFELAELKKRTDNLSAEVEQIVSQATKSAEDISAQIITDAQNQANKIVELAEKRIAVEEKAAVQQLQAKLLGEAIQDAQQTLSGISDAEKKQSVEAFLKTLPQLAAKK